MVYLGSKEKYSKYIVPIIQEAIDNNNIDTYIEPFVGGASIITKVKCKNRIGYDISDTLIALLCQARDDFSKVLNICNRELWDKGKEYVKNGVMPDNMTLADIGAIEFFGSYAARGFPGGMANNKNGVNYFQQRRSNMEKQSPMLAGIDFKVSDYKNLKNISNSVIYCDPPYANTKQYGYANKSHFDYVFFWDWVRMLSKNNIVFISEQTAPSDFKVIWEKEAKRTVGTDNNFKATEKLFQLK